MFEQTINVTLDNSEKEEKEDKEIANNQIKVGDLALGIIKNTDPEHCLSLLEKEIADNQIKIGDLVLDIIKNTDPEHRLSLLEKTLQKYEYFDHNWTVSRLDIFIGYFPWKDRSAVLTMMEDIFLRHIDSYYLAESMWGLISMGIRVDKILVEELQVQFLNMMRYKLPTLIQDIFDLKSLVSQFPTHVVLDCIAEMSDETLKKNILEIAPRTDVQFWSPYPHLNNSSLIIDLFSCIIKDEAVARSLFQRISVVWPEGGESLRTRFQKKFRFPLAEPADVQVVKKSTCSIM